MHRQWRLTVKQFLLISFGASVMRKKKITFHYYFNALQISSLHVLNCDKFQWIMRTTFFWGRLREKKKYQHIIANWCFSNASRYQTFFHIYIQFEQIMNSCDFHFGETHSKLFRGSLFLTILSSYSQEKHLLFSKELTKTNFNDYFNRIIFWPKHWICIQIFWLETHILKSFYLLRWFFFRHEIVSIV